jgi:hypothetical protein
MSEFKELVNNTRKYLDYVENHYDNVQKAFNEFSKRLGSEKGAKKYNDFIWEIKFYDDYWYFILKSIIENHDLSKLGKEEFTAYRDNFYPLSEETKLANKEEFDKAWEHHKENNAHHWQSRVGKTFERYWGYEKCYLAIENAMDWIAMAYAFNENPINTYYLKNKDKMQLSDQDIKVIETVFEIMMDEELLGE